MDSLYHVKGAAVFGNERHPDAKDAKSSFGTNMYKSFGSRIIHIQLSAHSNCYIECTFFGKFMEMYNASS